MSVLDTPCPRNLQPWGFPHGGSKGRPSLTSTVSTTPFRLKAATLCSSCRPRSSLPVISSHRADSASHLGTGTGKGGYHGLFLGPNLRCGRDWGVRLLPHVVTGAHLHGDLYPFLPNYYQIAQPGGMSWSVLPKRTSHPPTCRPPPTAYPFTPHPSIISHSSTHQSIHHPSIHPYMTVIYN